MNNGELTTIFSTVIICKRRRRRRWPIISKSDDVLLRIVLLLGKCIPQLDNLCYMALLFRKFIWKLTIK